MLSQLRVWREFRLGLKTLWLHALRSLLTMLGMVFGVSSVIAMLAIGEGASAQALERIRALGSTNIIIQAQKPGDDASATNARILLYGLKYDDVDAIRAAFPTAHRVVPAKLIRKEAALGARSMDVRVVGTTSDWFQVVERPMIAGRPLTANDGATRRNVVVLTEQGARRLLGGQGALGSALRIGGVSYSVVGVVQSAESAGGGIAMPDQAVDAYVPIEVAQARYGDLFLRFTSGSSERELVELHQIIIETPDVAQVETYAQGVERLLALRHPKGDYQVSVPLTLLKQAEATKRTFSVVLGSIAGISLLVGGIGIMNIMLASVTERTREIGIRRAIGARRSHIIRQFLIETLVLSIGGGLLGLILGLAIPAAVTAWSGLPTVVTPWSVALALSISGLIGMVFGLYPAIRAAHLDPIQALRHE